MFYRNLTAFRIPACDLESTESALLQAMPDHCLGEVGPLELSARGWVSPIGASAPELINQAGFFLQLALGISQRLLPGSVVNEALSKRLEHIRESEGRNPGGRERKRIKDEILVDLIPRSFIRTTRILGHIDARAGWLVVDTSSRKNAETFATLIRETLGSFPAVPVSTENSPRALMTAWIDGEPLPEGFVLDDECELRDPVDSGAVIKASRQELSADEIREHLACGKQAFRVGLVFEERISFVLDEGMGLRKVKFLEAATEALEDGERDSQRQECEAVFALQSAELARLLDRLARIFGVSEAAP